MTTPFSSCSDTVSLSTAPQHHNKNYNHSPSIHEASPTMSQICLPLTSPDFRPALSPSSSSWSTPSYASSHVRDHPCSTASHRQKGFSLPRFSLWGRSTPETLLSDRDACFSPSTDIPSDLDELRNSQRRAHSPRRSIDLQRLNPEADSPSRPSSSAPIPSMPSLTVIAPAGPSPMSSPKLASVWRLGGGLFASSANRLDRRNSSKTESTCGSDPAIVPPASQFAAWSELMQDGAAPDRSATFSSVSSTSCSSCVRPTMKKIRSQDSIRSSSSAQPSEAGPSVLHRHSLIPVPKAVKVKLRSKNKAVQEPDFDRVFLAQELGTASSITQAGSVGRNAQEARSPSLVQKELPIPSVTEKRSKRSSWAPRRSTSSRTTPTRRSADLARAKSIANGLRSSDEHVMIELPCAQRGRMDRQFSTCSHLTTLSSTTHSSASHSSNSDDVVPPKSPIMAGDVGISEDSRNKRSKSATPKPKTYAMQFSLDGRYLAVAGSDHLVRVYEVISSPCDRAEEIDQAQAYRAEEAAQRKTLSACNQGQCCFDRSTTKADVRAGVPELAPVFKSRPVRIFAGHNGDILDLSWSKNNFLLSCGSDKTAKLWHPNREACLCTFTTSATISSIEFHPTDDRFFVTGGLDGKLRLWNISARRVQSLTDVPGVITAVAFSSSGSVVIVGTHAGSVLTFSCTDSLFYLNSTKVKSAAASKSTQPSKITGLQPIRRDLCSPEAKACGISIDPAVPTKGEPEYILVTSNDSRVRIYSITSNRVIARLKSTSYVNRSSQIRATITSDAHFVVSGSEDASIHVWSLASNASVFGNLFSGIRKNKSIVKSNVVEAGDHSTWRSWQAGTGIVRCAILAPAATNELLAMAQDPLESEGSEKVGVRARIVVSTDDTNAVRVWRCDPLSRLL